MPRGPGYVRTTAAVRYMVSELIVRTASQADIPSLLDLYQQLNPGDAAPAPEDARHILAQLSLYSGSAILLGVVDGKAAATCTLVVVPNLTRGGAPYGLIENVVTDTRYRKRGFGKTLLKEAIAAAWKHDCYKVMLLTGSKDPATTKFYSGAGFEQSKTGFQVRRIPARQS